MANNRSEEATVRIISVLQVLADQPMRGVEVTDLVSRAGGYSGTPDSQKDALSRDLRHLRKCGFEIDNLAGEGEEARYRLKPGDDRIRVAFAKDQLFQLQRAAVLVGVDRLALAREEPASPGHGAGGPVIEDVHVPAVLGDVQRAVTSGAVAKFAYSGRDRTVHPYGLRVAPRGWVLEGWEQESGQAKVFSLQKMGRVRIGLPGTAAPPERSGRPTLDPLRFEIDQPAQAVLEVVTRFRPQVDAVLHEPLHAEPGPPVAGEATELLHYRVTNHTNFLVRVLRLDERVRLLGDDILRAALGKMLVALREVE